MSAGSGPKFCLRWDGFRSRLSSVFEELRRDDELMDMTLCCDGGQTVRAHRILLSASSPCLRRLIKEHPCQHPVVFLKDTSAEDLAAVIEFVYRGEVNVSQTQLASFIKTAEMLQIQGLSGEGDAAPVRPQQTPPAAGSSRETPTAAPPPVPTSGPPPSKRPRPAADSPAAAGTAGTARRSGTIKSEPVELSDDDADLEETLACLSNFEESGPVRPGPPADAADTPAAAAPAASGASLQGATGRKRTCLQAQTNGSDALYAILDHDQAPGAVTRSSRRTSSNIPVVFETNDVEVLGLQSEHDTLPTTLTFRQIMEPQLDARILSPRTIRKINSREPLQKSDWREMMQSIYQFYLPHDSRIRKSRNWYHLLAESIIDQFPSVLPRMPRRHAEKLITARLKNKFKNSRKRLKEMRLRQRQTVEAAGGPAAEPLPGSDASQPSGADAADQSSDWHLLVEDQEADLSDEMLEHEEADLSGRLGEDLPAAGPSGGLGQRHDAGPSGRPGEGPEAGPSGRLEEELNVDPKSRMVEGEVIGGLVEQDKTEL